MFGSVVMLVQTGIGIGVCMGAVTACFLFVMGIIIVTILMKYKGKKEGNISVYIIFLSCVLQHK